MGAVLDHIMIVADDSATWSALSRPFWDQLADELGAQAAAAGARWLTIRPYGTAAEPAAAPRDGGAVPERLVFPARPEPGTDGAPEAADARSAPRCAVIVDPRADGRQGFAEAAARAAAADALDEKGIVEALYAPAAAEPDLIVICGASNHLPPSLVWELAYGELVYVDAGIRTLHTAQLEEAIGVYTTRTRRFGGL